jgi:signal transduction histidine kinase
LLVADDNVRSYCEWRMDLPLQGIAKSGDALTLEWKELFSVGEGGVHAVNYGRIPPGDYVFQVMAASPEGALTKEHATLAISIPTVFWKTPGFLTLAGLTGAGALATWVRHLTRRRLQRRLEQLEQQRALERERSRIAQDIHDDLGASLTRINLLSQSALGKLPDGHPAFDDAARIRSVANDLTRALDEVVWAVNPRHDTLDSLVPACARAWRSRSNCRPGPWLPACDTTCFSPSRRR